MALLLKANTILSQCILAVNNAVHNLKRAIQLHFTFKWIIAIPYISGLSFKKLNFPSKSRNFPLLWASKNIKTPAPFARPLPLFPQRKRRERAANSEAYRSNTPSRGAQVHAHVYIYIYIYTYTAARTNTHTCAFTQRRPLSSGAATPSAGAQSDDCYWFSKCPFVTRLMGFPLAPSDPMYSPLSSSSSSSLLLLLLLVHPRLHFGGGSSGAPDYEPPPRCEQALLVRGGPADIAPAGGHLRRALASIIQLDACRSIVE